MHEGRIRTSSIVVVHANTPHRLKTRGAGKAAVPWVFASGLARTHSRLRQSEAHRYREHYRSHILVVNSGVGKSKEG